MERLADLTDVMQRNEAAADFANICRLLAKESLQRGSTQHELERAPRRVQRVLKGAVAAGSFGSSTWGDDLAYEQAVTGFMSLLSPRTLLGRIPFPKTDFFTRTFAEDTPGTATWLDEGKGIPISRLSSAVVRLGKSKIIGLCIFTNEFVETGSPAVLDNIRRAMTNTVGRYSDEALLNPDIAAGVTSPASLTNGASQVTSTGSTEAAITADVKSLIQVHVDAGSDLQELYICMHPQTALHMAQLLTAGNVRAFPGLGVRGGEIFGVPVLTSVGAVCTGSPTEKVVAVINAAGSMVADSGTVEIAASNQIAVEMDDAPSGDAVAGTGANLVSLYQVESVAIKFVRPLNFSRTGTDAVSYMRVGY